MGPIVSISTKFKFRQYFQQFNDNLFQHRMFTSFISKSHVYRTCECFCHFLCVVCSSFRPLGMRNGKIKESQLSSSSYMKTEMNKTGNPPHFSRPGSIGVFMVEDGLLQHDRNHFLQVDFRSRTKVEMVMNL